MAAEKKRAKSLQEAAEAKKAIGKLQDKIEQQYAREIAKACRASGISLEEVLNWVKAQQQERISKENSEGAVPATAKRGRKAAPRPKGPRKTPGRKKKVEESETPVVEAT